MPEPVHLGNHHRNTLRQIFQAPAVTSPSPAIVGYPALLRGGGGRAAHVPDHGLLGFDVKTTQGWPQSRSC
jgi:hypothetical protein